MLKIKIKTIIILLSQFIWINSFAQSVVWTNKIAGNSEEYGNAIAIDNQGNVITTGCFQQIAYGVSFALSSFGGNDIFIQKLSSDGTFQWVKQFGSVNADVGHSVITDSLGNIYVAGTFLGSVYFGTSSLSSSVSNSKFFLLKISPTGDILWRKTIPGTLSDKPKLAIDSSDNLYFSGAFEGTRTFGSTSLNSHDGRGFVSKINTLTGDIIWATQFGSGTSLNGQPVVVNVTSTHIAVDALNNIYITGGFAGHGRFGTENIILPNNFTNTFIAKLNGQGVFQWTKIYTGSSEGTGIVVDATNNFYTVGKYKGTVIMNNTTYTADATNYSIYFQKFDANGTLVWFKNYDLNTDSSSYSIPQLAIDNQSNLFLKTHFYNTITFEGTTYNHLVSTNPNILKNQILATYTSDGINIWKNQYEGANDYTTFGLQPNKTSNIAITNDGLYFTSGSSKFNDVYYSQESGANAFIAKLSLPVLSSQNELFSDDKVLISPNPSNGQVKIDFKLENLGVKVLVYNILGQNIFQNNYNSVENIEVELPSESGVYIFEIMLNNHKIIKKIIRN